MQAYKVAIEGNTGRSASDLISGGAKYSSDSLIL